MLNFTVGPVMSDEIVCKIGAEQVPYFRTSEFSETMLENEVLVKELANADDSARVVFLTASSTGAMEATVMNVFAPDDKVLVINGGSFGARFVKLCKMHGIPCTEIIVPFGKQIKEEQLEPYRHAGYTGLLVNIHETSTGVYFDMDMLSRFCREEGLVFVVDAVSSFLADEFDMQGSGADVMITGSQKALACPPGISLIVLSAHAIDRIKANHVRSMYFDLEDALKNGERGQTPFTPAVGILLQINARLHEIIAHGGAESEIKKTKRIAKHFRNGIKGLPLKITSESMSNAVTPLHPLHMSAFDIFLKIKDEYQMWICPNGGDLADKIFRVGHIGALTIEDNEKLIYALKEILR